MDVTNPGGGSSREIGELVIVSNATPAAALTKLVKADGRIVPKASISATLAARLASITAIGTAFVERKPANFVSSSRVGKVGGNWVAFAYSNSYTYPFTSVDMITWTQRAPISYAAGQNGYSPVGFEILNGKGYGLVFGGGTNILLHETVDGVTFTTAGKATGAAIGTVGGVTINALNKFRALNNRLIYVGGSTTGVSMIVFSTDTGVTWQGGKGVLPNNLNDIAYGNGVYVAVANGGMIETSPDLLAWTARASGVTEALYAVVFDPDLGRFVAFGASGRVLTSPDAINWTKAASIDGVTTPTDVAYVSGNFVLVASSTALDSRRRIMISPDLVNWRNELIGGSIAATGIPFDIAIDGNRIAIAHASGIAITDALTIDPVTQSFIPNHDVGPYDTAYYVNEA